LSAQAKGRIESRRAPRRIYKRPIGILCRGKYFLAQGLQVSESGMLFASEYLYDVKASIVVTLHMPDAKTVVARGEIVYQSKTPTGIQYGVKFRELDLQLRRIVRNYVSAKTQAEAAAERDE
jgi:hypothetical protein